MSKHLNIPDSCTTCSSCVTQCPVTAASRKFRGPKMVGPALDRFRRLEDDFEPSLEYCSNCKNCDMICPSNVPVSTLNMLARANYFKTHKHSLREWMLSHGELMAKMAGPAPAITNFGMSNPISRFLMKQIGISAKAPLPRYAAKSFLKQFKAYKQKSFDKKVVFFPGCFINYNDPQVGMDFVAVMQANNYEVIVPEGLVCCGSPLVVNGYLEEGEQNARKNVSELKKWIAKDYPIITCCTSCGLMLKQEAAELYKFEGVDDLAPHLYDSGEFLLSLYDQGLLNTNFKDFSHEYIYHAPCHLRAQGMGRPGLELLQMVPGIKITDADAGCCGISGSYGIKDDKYDISMEIGKQLFHKIRTSGVDTAVSECGTCRLQIGHGAEVKTIHPISVLRQAYGI